MKKLLIASPIKQRERVLAEFLNGLTELDLNGFDVHFYFVDDNTEENSSNLLKKFEKTHKNVLIRKGAEFVAEQSKRYECNEVTHFWKKELINRIIEFKNDMIRYAKENEFDYLFFVDSDIVMNPCTIKHLKERNVDIISNVFWTRWVPGGVLYPQVWLQDEGSYYIKNWDKTYTQKEVDQASMDFVNQMKIPGIYKVGGLGACTLLNRKSIESGVSFSLIDNVSFWGEDRHFCIRARVLGLGLYVDTVYPAYHIYRESYVDGIQQYKENGFDYYFGYGQTSLINTGCSECRWKKISSRLILELKKLYKRVVGMSYNRKRIVNTKHKLTVSMVVKNEENRYLRETLEHVKKYADEFIIIDDASTDNTVEVCKEILKDVPHKIIVNKKSLFSREYKLRRQQWDETIKMDPDWILFLDADEIFEDRMVEISKKLITNSDIDLYCFRLFDMWNNTHYRDDEYWNAHRRFMPFMMRYQPKFKYKFNKTNQHCGRMPKNVYGLNYANVDVRIKHYGWSREEDRVNKYNRYMELDRNGKHGILGQYESIMDLNPNLVRFEE